MEYFAQDEATRLDPTLTVYETLETGSPNDMVPAIRNILGGFLFTGDDVYKKAAVLSGGERTRLAVARMLLRPSNTLLLDEPTNHLDLDSKDVLLDALEDYGGTLIIVSHDRYFVERLATKIIEIGHGEGIVYPGTYSEFLWHKEHPQEPPKAQGSRPNAQGTKPKTHRPEPKALSPEPGAQTRGPKTKDERPKTELSREARKRDEAERRKKQRAIESLHKRIADLESRIAEREAQVKELESAMAAPGFYEDRDASRQAIDRHQALMWEVGDLMAQWEALQEHASEDAAGHASES
jgi:ATP-binding cassette subfamily F protein 3